MNAALALILCCGGLSAVVGQVPPVVTDARVTWTTSSWTGEKGSMPLGNGLVVAQPFIVGGSTLKLYATTPDSWDENTQYIKVTRQRFDFSPPLTETVNDGNYTRYNSTIGDQNAHIDIGSFACKSAASCFSESKDLCTTTPGCLGFSLSPDWSKGLIPQLFSDGAAAAAPNDQWTSWFVPESPASAFAQTLFPENGTVTIASNGYDVTIWADPTEVLLHVDISRSDSTPFSVNVTSELLRAGSDRDPVGAFCGPAPLVSDTALATDPTGPLSDHAVYYHRNPYCSYCNTTMLQQGIPLSAVPNLFTNRTSGVAVGGTGFKRTSPSSVVASGVTGSVSLHMALLSKQTDTIDEWLSDLAGAVASASARDVQDVRSLHASTWEAFWGRSYVDISGNSTFAPTATAINNHYVWRRYMTWIQGLNPNSPVKFNGELWTVDIGTNGGPDARQWGAPYWWQNTRQPLYSALNNGDLDVLRSAYEFYTSMLPAIRARTQAQFPNVSDSHGYFPETTTRFGTYRPIDWGCSTPPSGPSTNEYIRYHFTGNLELCLLLLDDWVVTGDEAVFKQYGVPVLETVLGFYTDRFTNRDADGKMDMFPAQSLETWQCADPNSRTNCVTNPVTDVAGLQAVLSRAVNLPSSLVDGTTLAAWKSLLSILPPLPMDPSSSRLIPGKQYPSQHRNSENVALYAVHPFRLFGVKKPSNLTVGINTYNARLHPCNDGWCQDVLDAPLLGLVDEAAKLVSQRATSGVASGWRFQGYAAHMQDYEPSLDHYSWLKAAVNLMVMQPLDDEAQSILLFPSFPSSWAGSFKLTGPLNTVVEATCEYGKLTHLSVTPSSRLKDIVNVGCNNA